MRRGHFDGWEAGVVAVAIAAIGLLLAVPRAVPPSEVPLPVVPSGALVEARRREEGRAARLEARAAEERGASGYDLRLAGDLLRQIGLADHAKDRERVSSLRDRLSVALGAVKLGAGDEALVELRAFQERVFLRELSRWEVTGEETNELIEVAGDFLGLAERSGWIGPRHALSLDDAVRGALFRKRFGEITALREGVFSLTTEEQRHLLGFFLAHPPPGGAGPPIADPVVRERATAQWLLRKVDELASIDDTYPAAFARGVLFYRAGDPASSALAFRDHLSRHPDGPFTLRARNHLRAAESQIDPAR